MAETVIEIEDITKNVATSTEHVVTGEGIFDILMTATTAHIDAQYKLTRITATDYSTVYLGALQSVLAESIKFALQKQGAEAAVDLQGAQQLLVERQTKGFDDDAKQKLLKQSLDSWSVAYSVAKDANSIPDSIKVDVIDSIMKDVYTSLGMTITSDPIGIV